MTDFSLADWCFIALILLVIHGVMLLLTLMRRRKASPRS
jgi:hypothetical protein